MDAIKHLEQVPEGINCLIERIANLESLLLNLSGINTATGTPLQPEYVTRKEAAKILGVSYPTLRKLTNDGKVVGYRINSALRYKRDDIEAALTKIKSKNEY